MLTKVQATIVSDNLAEAAEQTQIIRELGFQITSVNSTRVFREEWVTQYTIHLELVLITEDSASDDLERELHEAVKREDYERAAQLRDKINNKAKTL